MSVTGILRQLTYFRTPRCRVECQPCPPFAQGGAESTCLQCFSPISSAREEGQTQLSGTVHLAAHNCRNQAFTR